MTRRDSRRLCTRTSPRGSRPSRSVRTTSSGSMLETESSLPRPGGADLAPVRTDIVHSADSPQCQRMVSRKEGHMPIMESIIFIIPTLAWTQLTDQRMRLRIWPPRERRQKKALLMVAEPNVEGHCVPSDARQRERRQVPLMWWSVCGADRARAGASRSVKSAVGARTVKIYTNRARGPPHETGATRHRNKGPKKREAACPLSLRFPF